jgi:hypothetical protein
MEERAGERRHSRDRLLAQMLAENDLLKVHEEIYKGPPLPDPPLPPREEREKPALVHVTPPISWSDHSKRLTTNALSIFQAFNGRYGAIFGPEN